MLHDARVAPVRRHAEAGNDAACHGDVLHIRQKILTVKALLRIVRRAGIAEREHAVSHGKAALLRQQGQGDAAGRLLRGAENREIRVGALRDVQDLTGNGLAGVKPCDRVPGQIIFQNPHAHGRHIHVQPGGVGVLLHHMRVRHEDVGGLAGAAHAERGAGADVHVSRVQIRLVNKDACHTAARLRRLFPGRLRGAARRQQHGRQSDSQKNNNPPRGAVFLPFHTTVLHCFPLPLSSASRMMAV